MSKQPGSRGGRECPSQAAGGRCASARTVARATHAAAGTCAVCSNHDRRLVSLLLCIRETASTSTGNDISPRRPAGLYHFLVQFTGSNGGGFSGDWCSQAGGNRAEHAHQKFRTRIVYSYYTLGSELLIILVSYMKQTAVSELWNTEGYLQHFGSKNCTRIW